MKDQSVKKMNPWLAPASSSVSVFRQTVFGVGILLLALFLTQTTRAISLDDIQIWTGAGTNRAALVIEWNSPEVLNQTTVAPPIATKALVWGYRFNGQSTGTTMLKAVLATDPKLYVVADDYYMGSTYVEGIGYNLSGNGVIGIADSSTTNYFTNGFLLDPAVNVDAARPLNAGDLYWSGSTGPYWQLWNELGDAGGFSDSPNIGTNQFMDPGTYTHGQWASAYNGLDDLTLTNGSWIGFSISAAGYPLNTNDPNYAVDLNIFNNDETAPVSPDGTYTAYVSNTNDFAVAIVSTNNIYGTSPYDNPAAVLGRPTLNFIDYYGTGGTERTKIAEPPYWTDPAGNDVITEISSNGEITVQLGRKVYHDSHNPYGIDLIVYGNSFLSASGTDAIDDSSDLGSYLLGTGIYGHATVVSVSQDGTNWYTYSPTATLYPDEAYRWDETNHAWTDEQMNPTKPLNPFVYTNNFAGQSVASGLDQFIGAAGGSGYDLAASGLPWIQYVRITPGAGVYTVIDAIAAVNPTVVGDALSIAPDNLAAGITNLSFQNPGDASQNEVSLNFDSVSDVARVSTVSLHEFSSFAPLIGHVSSAYQITVKPVADANPISFLADLALHPAGNYSGTGSDLRVWQWQGTNWAAQPFAYDAVSKEAMIAGVTNGSAYVVTQIIPPTLGVQPLVTNQVPSFTFTPVPNVQQVLERSVNLITWTTVATINAINETPVTVSDSAAPGDKAFYRLRVTVPTN